MKRQDIFNEIDAERSYQDSTWGPKLDQANTPNDWVAYITKYAGRAVTMPFDPNVFRAQLIKVAALATAALEQDDYAPRHYDYMERLG